MGRTEKDQKQAKEERAGWKGKAGKREEKGGMHNLVREAEEGLWEEWFEDFEELSLMEEIE